MIVITIITVIIVIIIINSIGSIDIIINSIQMMSLVSIVIKSNLIFIDSKKNKINYTIDFIILINENTYYVAI